MELSSVNHENTNSPEFRYKQLQDFESDVDWEQLIRLIAHPYVESGIGKLQIPVESMIRVYFLQTRYKLSAAEISLALNKIEILMSFALIDLKTDVVPEEFSIDSFTSLIKLNGLEKKFLEVFNIQPMNQSATST